MSFPTPAVPSGASPALDRRIERLREAARSEPRLGGVLLYGSWTLGEADAYSDIEAYLFIEDAFHQEFDGREFLRRLGPLKLACTTMYGILAVVFDDLMRGSSLWRPQGPASPRSPPGGAWCTFPLPMPPCCSTAVVG
ncbi:hypothetical protein [Streptomyces sp. NPDC101393]|uniref:hypothetical protein n=1 Tax=Streptomyces sp. NPDC101393 TaxID=3366141 RepID=UPI0037FEE642